MGLACAGQTVCRGLQTSWVLALRPRPGQWVRDSGSGSRMLLMCFVMPEHMSDMSHKKGLPLSCAVLGIRPGAASTRTRCFPTGSGGCPAHLSSTPRSVAPHPPTIRVMLPGTPRRPLLVSGHSVPDSNWPCAQPEPAPSHSAFLFRYMVMGPQPAVSGLTLALGTGVSPGGAGG